MHKHIIKSINVTQKALQKLSRYQISSSIKTYETNSFPNKFNNKILNGTILSQTIRADLKERVNLIISKYKILHKPKLKIILIGDRKDSRIYVENKIKTCKYIGVESELKHFGENVCLEKILSEINYSNSDPNIHGIIIQLPVPLELEAYKTDILSKVIIEKDVDGLNPLNQGKILQMNLTKTLVPPTAMGVLELVRLAIKFDNNIDNYIENYLLNFSFSEEEVDLSSLDVCVLGRGLTSGLPISILMQKCNGTVTLCHSLSDIEKVNRKLKESDIIITAVGKKNLLNKNQIKENSLIIDVGINVENDVYDKSKKKVCGDVDFMGCLEKAKFITPVPGGVGRMTVVMLIKNVIKSWIISNNIDLNEINDISNLCYGNHSKIGINFEEVKEKIFDFKKNNGNSSELIV